MSRTIDERVVEMRFDNKQFEQNVQTSISSIEKLEKSLNLKGASKGLEDVNVAAKNCNMTPLSNAVETAFLCTRSHGDDGIVEHYEFRIKCR